MTILEKPKINNLPFHLSKLVKGKEEKEIKQKLITLEKRRLEINNKTRSCNSKEKKQKKSKNGKSLSTLIKKKKEKTQIKL